MELFKKYLKERTPHLKLMTDNEKYFLTYQIREDHVYIEDIFIEKDFRGGTLSHEVTDKIFAMAKELGKDYVLGSCCPSTNYPERSLVAMFRYGFKLHSSEQDMIWLIKKVE